MVAIDRNAEEKKQWCLEAVADADREWLVTIDSVPFIIGRAEDCDLKLIDKRISRHHTEIRISGDMLWIRDLGSTNGTFVNQNQIEQSELLELNDFISIGEYEFQVKKILSSASAIEDQTVTITLPKELRDLSSFRRKLRVLLDERNVIPHFQPIVKFSDKTAVGYEILGRIDSDGLPSSPAELLELADTLGCAFELSSLFLEVGVDIGKNLSGLPLLFVNTNQNAMHEMDALVASLQKIRDIAPTSKIVLEINEKAAAGTDDIAQLRDALKKMEMGLAFDDFGVGESRLVALANISPDYLKFDMSLIKQIHLAPQRLHQMVSTFVKAAHDLGIITLAEGIECAEEAEVCQQLGFDLAQGFFFGKPAPFDAIEINPGEQ